MKCLMVVAALSFGVYCANGSTLTGSTRPASLSHQAPVRIAKRARSDKTGVCIPLEIDQPKKQTLSQQQRPCFTIKVGSDEAAQLQLDQPDDLEMRITGESGERRIDGFEFGIETLTISEPGRYRIEVSQVKPSPGSSTFTIVRWKIDMEKASAWKEAEDLATKGKKSKHAEDLERALQLWTALGDYSSVARTRLILGFGLSLSDSTKARVEFEKALEMCKATFDTRCTAEAENNSGQMSSRLGDFSEARQSLEEAVRDWRRIPDPKREGAALSNLGLMLSQTGDYYHAISMLRRAKELQRNRDVKGYAIDLNNLGLCYHYLADYRKARWYFERAVQSAIRANNPSVVLSVQTNLGRNYMLEGNLQRATEILERSLIAADKLALPKADLLRNFAQCLFKMGKVDQAEQQLQLALAIDQTTGNRRGQSSALHFLGLIAQKNGEVANARSLLTQALQLRMDVGLRDDATETLAALADLEYQDKHPEAARTHAEQALKLLESIRGQVADPTLRAVYYARKRKFFDLLVDIAMSPENPNALSDGLLAVEQDRARSLIDLLGEGNLQRLPPELVKRRDRIQRQIDFLAASFAARKQGGADELHKRVQGLLVEAEVVETQIRESLKTQPLGHPLQSVEELQKCIPADSAVIEYQIGNRQSHLWLITPNSIQAFTLPAEAAIESAAIPVIAEFGNWLERRREPAREHKFEQLLHHLSAKLLGPLAGVQLPSRLILVPDRVLLRVPFAALPLPHSYGRLGLVHDLIQVPSAAYLTIGKLPPPITQFAMTILAVADPVFSPNDTRVTMHDAKIPSSAGPDLPRLPFMAEIKAIEERVPSSRRRILQGFAASSATLRHFHLEDFGILHFSTHAIIDDRIAELSQIVLSTVTPYGRPMDGALRPYQLAQFHLGGAIVVLSACETALGKQVLGEGLMGFSNSLFYAGASQLVLTLDKVDADASSRFLSHVYQEFLPQGTNDLEHSLTLARRSMAHDHTYSDPYYWASFIVIGCPRDMLVAGADSPKHRR